MVFFKGEGVIFMVAVGVLAFEYNRQNKNEKNKERTERDFLSDLESKVYDLSLSNEQLEAKVRELTRLVHSIPKVLYDKVESTRFHKIFL